MPKYLILMLFKTLTIHKIMQSVHLIVSGKVQGVFFRKHTKRMADHFQICGTVQNLPDGSVEIFAEGEQLQVQKFVDWCKSGPDRANVSSVDIHETAVKNYSDFRII